MFFKSRLVVATVVMILLFSILLWRIFSLQIVNGKEYQNNYTFKIVKERTLNSTRGNIYDRNGNLLAYNELAYSITIEDNGTYSSTKAKNAAINAEIAQVVTALEENGDGDCLARTKIRFKELINSLIILEDVLARLQEHDLTEFQANHVISALPVKLPERFPNMYCPD